MDSRAWRLVCRISLVVLGLLAVLSAANRIAGCNGGEFLPDIVVRVIGIVDMVCLFLCVFSRIKGNRR
ncbi:MAG: hypothetical protein SPD47_07380 [Oscillospiraceae bacterium]|nr:hypothetical protein [Oscillospiraceae bacterium]